jgi:outer membrane protein OmpA-like peptidoglycan-associated protein
MHTPRLRIFASARRHLPKGPGKQRGFSRLVRARECRGPKFRHLLELFHTRLFELNSLIMPNTKAFVLNVVIAWFASLIPAHAQHLPVEISVRDTVNLPQESPRLTLKTQEPIRNLKITVSEHGNLVASKSYPQLGRDAVQYLTWPAGPGLYDYRIDVSGKTAAGQASASLQANVRVMRPLEIFLERERVDLNTRRIHFRINNPPGHVEIIIYNIAGRPIYEADIDLRVQSENSEIVLSWPQLDESIARIELRVFDISESWVGIELLPYRVEIPHVDVVFETNKWNILPSEKVKLDDAYQRLIQAIKEHGADIKACVYILGHTDTVGSVQHNMVLSGNRANAIATYFRNKRGITLPILACGFGELMLAVKTADEVDEQRNRRAQYILAAEEPLPCNWTVVSPGSRK